MADDQMYAFLDLDGIQGSAQDSDFEDQIPLRSVSWGATNHGGFEHGTGGSKHRGQIHELSISKIMCRATPTLMQYCTTGDHIEEGTLSLCWQSGDTKKAYYQVKFKKIRVTAYQMAGGSGAEHPMESLSLQFAEMEKTYTPQDNSGSAEGGVRFAWNLQKNEKA
jgi:type VI secretion system secreted protein Hcp